jgi:toxin ParE1/3/4
MAYRVEFVRNAEAELEELYLWVTERAPDQGAAWFNGLERAILSLEQLPRRCRIASESFDPGQPVRVLNYGRSPHVYRIFFTIDEGAGLVNVVHIRRGARRRASPSELTGRWRLCRCGCPRELCRSDLLTRGGNLDQDEPISREVVPPLSSTTRRSPSFSASLSSRTT